MYKLFSILMIFSGFGVMKDCLSGQKQAEVTKQEKMPIIMHRGYNLLDKSEAGKLLNQWNGINGDSLKDKIAISVPDKDKIDYEVISELVSSIRNRLCLVNPGGSYEVWIQVEGGASWVVVSGSVQTGIKAIINCAAKENAGASK